MIPLSNLSIVDEIAGARLNGIETRGTKSHLRIIHVRTMEMRQREVTKCTSVPRLTHVVQRKETVSELLSACFGDLVRLWLRHIRPRMSGGTIISSTVVVVVPWDAFVHLALSQAYQKGNVRYCSMSFGGRIPQSSHMTEEHLAWSGLERVSCPVRLLMREHYNQAVVLYSYSLRGYIELTSRVLGY